jgi:trimeric autotransporter adhesin
VPNKVQNQNFQTVYAPSVNQTFNTVRQQVKPQAEPTYIEPVVIMNSLSVGTQDIGVPGEIRCTNNFTAYYSDDRMKDRIGNIENALEKLRSLSGFYYRGNELAGSFGYDTETQQVGVSAQEVQKVMPEVVAPAPINENYMTVRYDRLVPLLIEAIKELDQEIQDIKSKL